MVVKLGQHIASTLRQRILFIKTAQKKQWIWLVRKKKFPPFNVRPGWKIKTLVLSNLYPNICHANNDIPVPSYYGGGLSWYVPRFLKIHVWVCILLDVDTPLENVEYKGLCLGIRAECNTINFGNVMDLQLEAKVPPTPLMPFVPQPPKVAILRENMPHWGCGRCPLHVPSQQSSLLKCAYPMPKPCTFDISLPQPPTNTMEHTRDTHLGKEKIPVAGILKI